MNVINNKISSTLPLLTAVSPFCLKQQVAICDCEVPNMKPLEKQLLKLALYTLNASTGGSLH